MDNKESAGALEARTLKFAIRVGRYREGWVVRLSDIKAEHDEFIKSRKTPFFVIPAEAGIQSN